MEEDKGSEIPEIIKISMSFFDLFPVAFGLTILLGAAGFVAAFLILVALGIVEGLACALGGFFGLVIGFFLAPKIASWILEK
ncbi:MAG TPA: hypothetical protein PLI45_03090 [Candidatus Woesebacteria bacterium]|nr:hypothetical protein [Candidatus Woesebacteria bacterium]